VIVYPGKKCFAFPGAWERASGIKTPNVDPVFAMWVRYITVKYGTGLTIFTCGIS
jgi:hypothetical protein